MQIALAGLTTLPEVEPGNDLAQLIRDAAEREGRAIGAGTIVVVAQKVVSKSEGARVDLRTIQPSHLALEWARAWNKDPRVVELVFREARRIVRMDRGVIVAETCHGFIAANAGVDQSNVPGGHYATVLPRNPDECAQRLRRQLGCGAVIISDTFGRPWREGLVNVAIGVSGLPAIQDLRGCVDREGRTLSATILATGDELAAAAGLLMPKSGGVPVVLIEGYEWKAAEGSARDLIRPAQMDLFR